MPGEKAQNLQDAFLNHVRKQKVPVTIFLVNGVKLQGVITLFENFCLLLRRDAQSQATGVHRPGLRRTAFAAHRSTAEITNALTRSVRPPCTE